MSNGEQDKLDITHIHSRLKENTETNDCIELMASKCLGVEQNPNHNGKQVLILVDSGALSIYFDAQIILGLKHRLLHHVDLTVPGKILTAGGSQLDGTTEGLLQDFITGEYVTSYLVRIGILIISGIGNNLSSVKVAAGKIIFSSFNKTHTWKATA